MPRAGQVRLGGDPLDGVLLWRTGEPCDCDDPTCTSWHWTDYADEGSEAGVWHSRSDEAIEAREVRARVAEVESGRAAWTLGYLAALRDLGLE